MNSYAQLMDLLLDGEMFSIRKNMLSITERLLFDIEQ